MLKKIFEGKSLKEISQETGIPLSTLYYKLRKLKEEGILKEKIEISWEKIGYQIRAIVLIETENTSLSDQEKIIKEISKIDGILSGKIVSGRYDIMIEIVSKDLNEFSKKLDIIKKIKGIKRTETLFILGEKEC